MSNVLDILGVGASVASGGLFGVLGAAFGTWMKAKERREQAIDKQKDREHQLNLIKLQQASTSQQGAWDGLGTSIKAQMALDQVHTNQAWVVAAKSLFRPFLTLFLWLAVGWLMYVIVQGSLQEYLTIAAKGQTLFNGIELTALIKYVVYSTVFSATTATTWWFGERALSLPDAKNR